jgi:hypothetical protein
MFLLSSKYTHRSFNPDAAPLLRVMIAALEILMDREKKASGYPVKLTATELPAESKPFTVIRELDDRL